MKKETVIECTFMGNFNLGDNICHTLESLALLYEIGRSDRKKAKLMMKPIVVTITSVIEALLYDLLWRGKIFTKEKIKNISKAALDDMKEGKRDTFETIIALTKKHSLFGKKDSEFYAQLDELRKLRNRIHIQNTKNYYEPKDSDAFTLARVKMAQKALETILHTLREEYYRSESHKYVGDFVLPWKAHFPALSKK